MRALHLSNPNPNLCLRRPSSMSISNRIYSPPAVRFDRLLRESQPSAPRKGLGARSLALNRGRRTNLSLIRSFVLHAASHEESVSGTRVLSSLFYSFVSDFRLLLVFDLEFVGRFFFFFAFCLFFDCNAILVIWNSYYSPIYQVNYN